MTEATPQIPWRLKVHNIEGCNCNTGCGCRFGGHPDYGLCEAMHGFEIIEGHYDDVDLTGVRAVLAGKWPKAVHEGHGHAVLFVDAAARPDQVAAVESIFRGQAGGMPWAWYATTFDVFEGPILLPIEMTVNGRRSSVRIPGILDMHLTPLTHPRTGAEKEVHIVFPHGGGGFGNDLNVATTAAMRIAHGALTFQHPGQFAAHAVVEWTNQS